MTELPQPFQEFRRDFPDVAQQYEALAAAAHSGGPLTDRERRLVKLAIAIGGRLEGAVRAHARQAAEKGVSTAELDHVVLLALTTIGLPSTVAARSWIQDELGTAP
jgi:alkylhydroperoxidase/carboxymuconolactone decarboxylase family protein YurZ